MSDDEDNIISSKIPKNIFLMADTVPYKLFPLPSRRQKIHNPILEDKRNSNSVTCVNFFRPPSHFLHLPEI